MRATGASVVVMEGRLLYLQHQSAGTLAAWPPRAPACLAAASCLNTPLIAFPGACAQVGRSMEPIGAPCLPISHCGVAVLSVVVRLPCVWVAVWCLQVCIEELHALFQGTVDVWAVSNLGMHTGSALPQPDSAHSTTAAADGSHARAFPSHLASASAWICGTAPCGYILL
jgi:hypothetical protein